jgi:SH3-like domain-containing protein
MRKLLFSLTMMLCVSVVSYSQTDRNTRYIAVKTTPLKSSVGFFAKDLGALSLGDVVTVINEEGKWSQIQAGGLEGWVTSSSLSARRIVASNPTVTASEIAMAGKGFSPDMEVEYRKDGLDYSMVDSMEQITVSATELFRFINEGRLARGE